MKCKYLKMELTIKIKLQFITSQHMLEDLHHTLTNDHGTELDFESLCPLEGRNRTEYWGTV